MKGLPILVRKPDIRHFRIILLILFALLYTPSVRAGEISLVLKTSVRVTGRNADVTFKIKNRSNEAAENVSLRATLLDKKRSISVSRWIPPGHSRKAATRFILPPAAKGTYPVFITMTYNSEDGIPISSAALGVVKTAGALNGQLSVTANRGSGSDWGHVDVKCEDPKASLMGAKLTCHVPDDLTVIPRVQQVRFKNGKASAQFRMNNMQGRTGSRYGVFITAEYEWNDLNHLSYAGLSVPIEETAPILEYVLWRSKPTLHILGILIFCLIILTLKSQKIRNAMRYLFHELRWPRISLDILAILIIEAFILSHINPQHLLTQTITTGGDTASHYYTAEYLCHMLLPQGKISGWTPGNYAGFPILQFYFPLSFLAMGLLEPFLSLQIAFKWITLLGTFLLPVAAYIMLRTMVCPFPGPSIGAAFTLPFLFHSGNSMWGGNILSTFAGEFSYSLSMALSLILLGSLYRGCLQNRGVVRNAILVFLVGFSHGYTLLFAEAMSIFFLITPKGLSRRVFYLGKVYALGFCFLAFWLVPLLVYSKYTIAYHMAWVIHSIKEIIPLILLPMMILAGVSTAGLLFWGLFTYRTNGANKLYMLGFLCFGLLMSGVMYAAAPKLGVVDIRYIPYAQLFSCLIGALFLGWVGAFLNRWGMSWALLATVLVGVLLWVSPLITKVQDWAKWNYEGFEAKPAWPLFNKINTYLHGTFQDPRVVYEHSPRHNKFGSSRAFESLPLFAGRATLEGLYMQASISAPFVFYIQSLISKEQSCPFHQYDCTGMDFRRARPRLEMFNVRDLIVRSKEAKAAIRADRAFKFKRRFGEYEIWQLDSPKYRYVVPLKYEPVLYPRRHWKMEAYRWFTRDALLDTHLVFMDKPSQKDRNRMRLVSNLDNLEKKPIDTESCRLEETIGNNEIIIETNWIDKPLLVKMSYHPNWRVEGAEEIYLVSPSFMLIFPTQQRVRLYYTRGTADWAGIVLTCIGLLILILNIPIPGQSGPTVWVALRQRVGCLHFFEGGFGRGSNSRKRPKKGR